MIDELPIPVQNDQLLLNKAIKVSKPYLRWNTRAPDNGMTAEISMNDHSSVQPYDFSTWEPGEDALSGVEAAVYDLIDDGIDPEFVGDWPDFEKIHDAVVDLVRAELASAFDMLQSGHWTTNLPLSATLSWRCEIDEPDDSPYVEIRPRAIIPLFMADLIGRLNQNPYETSDQDRLTWDERWEVTFRAAKEWQAAVQASLRGLKAIREERRRRFSRGQAPNSSEAD